MKIVIIVAAAIIALIAVGVIFVLDKYNRRKRNRERWNEVHEIGPVIAEAIFPGNRFDRTLKTVSERELMDWVYSHLWPTPTTMAIQVVIDILVYDRVLRRWPDVEPEQRKEDDDPVRACKYTFTKKGQRRFFPYWEYVGTIASC